MKSKCCGGVEMLRNGIQVSLLSWNKTVETKRITENNSLFPVFLNDLKNYYFTADYFSFFRKRGRDKKSCFLVVGSEELCHRSSAPSTQLVAAAGSFTNFTDDYFNDANKTVSNLRLIACRLEEVHLYLESFHAQILQVTT